MQASDAPTQGGGPDPHLVYALDFRAEGVALMRRERGVATLAKGRKFSVTQRPGGAWSEIAYCDWRPPESDGAAPALNAPERLLAALGDAPPEVDIWLPAEIVLSRTVEDPGATSGESAKRIAARAISGLTVLRPEVLVIDAAHTDTGVALKAVERSVLAEVSTHALGWGFAVRSVRSRPGDIQFPDGAVFSQGPANLRKPGRGLAALRPRAAGLIGGAAVLGALALYLLAGPSEPGAPEEPAAAARPPVASSPMVAEVAAAPSAGKIAPPQHAGADPAPSYQKLKAEVAFSAPAPQFTPSAETPELQAAPAIEGAGAPPPLHEAAPIDPGPIAIEPAEAPQEVAAAASAPSADAQPPAVDAPAPPPPDEAAELAPPASLGEVVVDGEAGEAGVEIVPPGESAPPEGDPAPPEATAPASETPSHPPARPEGLEEMGDADFAALSLDEAPVPLAPPAPAQRQSDPPPPAPRPELRPGATPEEPLYPAGEAENQIPITELAPESAGPPKPRPKAIAELAASEAPLEMSSLAPEAVAAPRPRPARIRELPQKLKEAAERAKAERAAKTAARRGAPTAAAIAAAATQHMEWETLDGFILIGVFERVSGRSALMRLPNGDVRRVEVGDRIGRWTVASVGDSVVSLNFEGRSQTLHLPGAN